MRRSLVVPVREYGVVVGCHGRHVLVKANPPRELCRTVRLHATVVNGRVIQTVRERQRYGGHRIVRVIAGVGCARDDGTTYLRDVVMVLRRTTLDCVISCEDRVSIAAMQR